MQGFLLLDKPIGPTSHDAVAYVRRILGVKRVGHAGTLDPFASGLLLVAVSREATRELPLALHLSKTYRCTARLGATSDTYDHTGIISAPVATDHLTEYEIQQAVTRLAGTREQTPPVFSAKKFQGKKFYEYARAGLPLPEEAKRSKQITVQLLGSSTVKTSSFVEVSFTAKVSSGTYIRSLVHELGEILGVGAYTTSLERTAVGPFLLENSCDWNELSPSTLLLPIEMYKMLLASEKGLTEPCVAV